MKSNKQVSKEYEYGVLLISGKRTQFKKADSRKDAEAQVLQYNSPALFGGESDVKAVLVYRVKETTIVYSPWEQFSAQ